MAKKAFVYDGSQWVDIAQSTADLSTYQKSNRTGLNVVVPTGATNGTVGANGAVTIGNAVTSVTVTGAFSATYDNYKIIVSGGSASNGMNMSFQLGSATTGYYAAGLLVPYTSTVTAVINDNNASRFNYVGYGMPNGVYATIEVITPFLARNTGMNANRTPMNTGSDYGAYGGFLNNTNSYTDFTITTGSAVTMTGGTIRIYGYNNN